MFTPQEMHERIKDLLKDQGKKQNEMLEKIQFRKTRMTDMKNGHVPNLEAIDRIADYLNTTTDYLLGRSDIAQPSRLEEAYITADEKVKKAIRILLEIEE